MKPETTSTSTAKQLLDGVHYPDIHVRIQDGNAFAILAEVRVALKNAGVSQIIIDAYTAEATSGDYDHLLHTSFLLVDLI
jgi:hypothetical protein